MEPTTKAMAEQSMMRFAREWWPGLGLELRGVQLGDALQYDLLRVQGQVWLDYLTAPRPEQAAQS